MWLTGRLAPDFKTIADFRRNNGVAIRNVCRRFVELCRGLKLLSSDMVAIDGSRFKAANSRDKNYTAGKIDKRRQQIEESVQRYVDAIETADRISPTGFDVKTVRLYEKIVSLRREMRELAQVDGESTIQSPWLLHERLLSGGSEKRASSIFSCPGIRHAVVQILLDPCAVQPIRLTPCTTSSRRARHGARPSTCRSWALVLITRR